MILFKRKKLIHQFVTFALILQFVGAHALWAQEGGVAQAQARAPAAVAVTGPPPPDEILALQVPEAFGNVKKSTLGTQDKVLIHIQDSHVNYEAQTNIAKILTHLIHELSLKNNGNGPGCLIAIEGAQGPCDPAWFRLFPNKEIKEIVLDYFLRRGFISGPQYFQVFAEEAVPVIGIEKAELYRENMAAFRETYSRHEEMMAGIDELERGMIAIRDALFNKDLKQFSEKSAAFHANRLVLTDYMVFMNETAKGRGVDLSPFGQITASLEAIQADKQINYDEVNKERNKLAEKLESKMTKEDVSGLVKNSLQFRLGKISSLEYHAFLEELARENDVEIENYPNLEKYLDALNLHLQIEGELLFQEIIRAEKKIKESLFQTKEERECDRMLHNLYLLRNLCKLEMSREELEEYGAHRDQFRVEEFLFFIEDQSSRLNMNLRIDPKMERVNGHFQAMEKFYQAALARDEALARRTLSAMDQAHVKTAIVVTGGFHTEGLVKIFENENFSTMVVSPRITQDAGNAAYLDAMLNERMPLEGVLNKRGNQLSQPLRMFVEKPLVGTAEDQMELSGELMMLYEAATALKDPKMRSAEAFQKMWEESLKGLPPEKQEKAQAIVNSVKPLEFTEDKRNDGLYIKMTFQNRELYVAISNRESAEKLVETMRHFFERTEEKGMLGKGTFAIASVEIAKDVLAEVRPVAEEARPVRRRGEIVLPAEIAEKVTKARENLAKIRAARKATVEQQEDDFSSELAELDDRLGKELQLEKVRKALVAARELIKNKNQVNFPQLKKQFLRGPQHKKIISFFDRIKNNPTLLETLGELIKEGSRYPLLPKSKILALDRSLANVRDKLSQAKTGEVYSLTEVMTKITNLKILNSRGSETANRAIQAAYLSLSQSDYFSDLKVEMGVLQKYNMAARVEPSVTGVPAGAKTIFTDENGLIEVYEGVVSEEIRAKIQKSLMAAKVGNEAELDAVVTQLYVKVTRPVETTEQKKELERVLNQFLSNRFRELTVASRYAETRAPRESKQKQKETPVHLIQKNEIKEYIFGRLRNIKEIKDPEEQQREYHELADIVSSFRLTDSGELMTVQQVEERVREALADAKEKTEDAKEKTGWEQVEAIYKLEDVLRDARREATGIAHPKFRGARGVALFVHDIKQPLSSKDSEARKRLNGNYLGQGDGHKIGYYNVECTAREMRKFEEHVEELDKKYERGEISGDAYKSERSKDLDKFLSNTGNERDKQLETYLLTMAHPDAMDQLITKKEGGKYYISDEQIKRLNLFALTRMAELLKKAEKEGLIDLPPPIEGSVTEKDRENLAAALSKLGKLMVKKENYKGYALGGDEMAVVVSDPRFVAILGGLIDILTDGLAGKEIYMAAGFGFALEIKAEATYSQIADEATLAQLVTKALKDAPADENGFFPNEKYAYTHGKALAQEVAEQALEGLWKQLVEAKSDTDFEKLEKQLSGREKDMWRDALKNVKSEKWDTFEKVARKRLSPKKEERDITLDIPLEMLARLDVNQPKLSAEVPEFKGYLNQRLLKAKEADKQEVFDAIDAKKPTAPPQMRYGTDAIDELKRQHEAAEKAA